MEYTYTTKVRENDVLRASFNELTQKTFWFNFEDWYAKKHWQDKYIPHVLVDGEKVISNVSVNIMTYAVNGEIKNFLQLGTVMTDEKYRGKGLNSYIIELILKEYKDRVDGIYLFGNDDVINYYPKFGFRPAKEYAYARKLSKTNKVEPYEIKKVDAENPEEWELFYEAVCRFNEPEVARKNPNDGFTLCDNVGLYFFWLESEFRNNIYYVPAADCYVVAGAEETTMNIYQVFSDKKLDIERFTTGLSTGVEEIKLHYTPVEKTGYEVTEYHQEDCTLFLLGDVLDMVEREKLTFSEMSHA